MDAASRVLSDRLPRYLDGLLWTAALAVALQDRLPSPVDLLARLPESAQWFLLTATLVVFPYAVGAVGGSLFAFLTLPVRNLLVRALRLSRDADDRFSIAVSQAVGNRLGLGRLADPMEVLTFLENLDARCARRISGRFRKGAYSSISLPAGVLLSVVLGRLLWPNGWCAVALATIPGIIVFYAGLLSGMTHVASCHREIAVAVATRDDQIRQDAAALVARVPKR